MEQFEVQTRTRCEFIDVTHQVEAAVQRSGVESGRAQIFVPHTTAAVGINEGADPSVQSDILSVLDRLVPHRDAGYRHAEGNTAAHVKALLVGPSETVIVQGGRLVLGTWQAIFFCEFDGPRRRRVLVDVAPR